MKLLVTGGGGFLGSHVCEYFRKQGANVIAYDNWTKAELMRTGYQVDGCREYMQAILKNLGIVIVSEDIRDLPTLNQYAEGCDLIIHCAAQPAMTIALEQPTLDVKTNVVGTVNVLEACRVNKIPMVNCSSIHVYGNGYNSTLFVDESGHIQVAGGGLLDEDDITMTGLITPLHTSKFAAEYYVRTYAESYRLPVATFRLTGMYGPRQFGGEDHGWVANFAIKTLLGLPIKVFPIELDGKLYPGTEQVRDIIYVGDVVDAFDRWYKSGCPAGLYNICGGLKTKTTLGEVLDYLALKMGKEQVFEPVSAARKGDLYHFVGSYMKAESAFGWRPQTSVSDGLDRLAEWVKRVESIFRSE